MLCVMNMMVFLLWPQIRCSSSFIDSRVIAYECAKWFVHQQKRWIMNQGAAYSHALLHSAGQFSGYLFSKPE